MGKGVEKNAEKAVQLYTIASDAESAPVAENFDGFVVVAFHDRALEIEMPERELRVYVARVGGLLDDCDIINGVNNSITRNNMAKSGNAGGENLSPTEFLRRLLRRQSQRF